MGIRKLLFTAVLLGSLVGTYAIAATQTLTGIVTDEMCGKKHTMLPGKPDSECVRECVKAGSKYALLVDGKLYRLNGDQKQLDRFAGKKAKVTGNVSGTAVAVSNIAEGK